MNVHRRDLFRMLTAAAFSGVVPTIGRAADDQSIYDVERFGNVRVLHMTDTHAQLSPVYFREPSDAPAFDAASGRVFKPATIKELGESVRHSAFRRDAEVLKKCLPHQVRRLAGRRANTEIDSGDKCRFSRKVPSRSRSRYRQGWTQGCGAINCCRCSPICCHRIAKCRRSSSGCARPMRRN